MLYQPGVIAVIEDRAVEGYAGRGKLIFKDKTSAKSAPVVEREAGGIGKSRIGEAAAEIESVAQLGRGKAAACKNQGR